MAVAVAAVVNGIKAAALAELAAAGNFQYGGVALRAT